MCPASIRCVDGELAAEHVVDRRPSTGPGPVTGCPPGPPGCPAARSRARRSSSSNRGDQDALHPLLLEQLQVVRSPSPAARRCCTGSRPGRTRSASSSTPRATSVKNGLATSSTTRPMVRLRPARSWRADSLRTKPSSSMASPDPARGWARRRVGPVEHVGDGADGDAGARGDVLDAGRRAAHGAPPESGRSVAVCVLNVSNVIALRPRAGPPRTVTIRHDTVTATDTRRIRAYTSHIIETFQSTSRRLVPGQPERRTGDRHAAARRCAHAAKAFGAVRALVDGSIDLLRRRGARAGRRERRRQVDAGEDPRRGAPAGQRRAAHRRRSPPSCTARPPPRAAGIAVIYQEPTLFPDLTVAENIFMGRQPLRRRPAHRPRRDAGARPRALFARLGVAARPRPARPRPVHRRPADRRDRQGALARRPGHRDGRADRRAVRGRGRAAVRRRRARCARPGPRCCSSRTASRRSSSSASAVTVMRDGSYVLTSDLAGADRRRPRPRHGRPRPGRSCSPEAATAQPGDVVLEVERPDPRGRVHRHLASACGRGRSSRWPGWSAPGRSEVARAIFGIDRYDAGKVDGRRHGAAARRRPRAAMAAGVGFVPEDRRQQGLVMDMSIAAEHGARLARPAAPGRPHPVRRPSARFAADWAQRLRLKYGRLTDPVSTLSGGNQQKVVLAKWLGRQPGAAHRRRADPRHRHRHQGRGAPSCWRSWPARASPILMISSELPEVLRHRPTGSWSCARDG